MTHQTFAAPLLRPLALGCALTCAWASGAFAAQGSLAQANSAVSNFQVQLIDLDVNDGIAPGIVFTNWLNETPPGIWAYGQMIFSGGNLASSSEVGASLTGTTSNLLPSVAQQVTSTDGLATVGVSPTSLSSSMTLQKSDLSRLAPADAGGYGDRQSLIVSGDSYIGQYARTPYYAATPSEAYVLDSPALDPSSSGQYSFVLTPNTRMVVTADLSASASFDDTQLPLDWQAAASHPSSSDYYVANSSAMGQAQIVLAQASASPGMLDSYPDFASYYAAQTAAYQWSEFYVVAADNILHNSTYALAQTGSARMVLDNQTGDVMVGALAIAVGSGAELIGPLQQPPVPLPGDVTPAIPEPSTYALMGLGLVGLVLVKRRASKA